MVESGHRPGLGPEALEEGGVAGQGRMEDLDGHPAVQGDVVGQVDVRGRTCPQGSDESVAVAEDTPDGVGDTRHESHCRLATGEAETVEGGQAWAPAQVYRRWHGRSLRVVRARHAGRTTIFAVPAFPFSPPAGRVGLCPCQET